MNIQLHNTKIHIYANIKPRIIITLLHNQTTKELKNFAKTQIHTKTNTHTHTHRSIHKHTNRNEHMHTHVVTHKQKQTHTQAYK